MLTEEDPDRPDRNEEPYAGTAASYVDAPDEITPRLDLLGEVPSGRFVDADPLDPSRPTGVPW